MKERSSPGRGEGGGTLLPPFPPSSIRPLLARKGQGRLLMYVQPARVREESNASQAESTNFVTFRFIGKMSLRVSLLDSRVAAVWRC